MSHGQPQQYNPRQPPPQWQPYRARRRRPWVSRHKGLTVFLTLAGAFLALMIIGAAAGSGPAPAVQPAATAAAATSGPQMTVPAVPPGTPAAVVPDDGTGGGSLPGIPHPHVHACVGRHLRICT